MPNHTKLSENMKTVGLIFKILGYLLIFLFLTVLTQIGGIVFLFSIGFYRFWLKKRILKPSLFLPLKISIFTIVYLITTFVIVPIIAKPLGRVPLPMFEKNHLRPANKLTCILNRNYVRPALKEAVENVAIAFNKQHNNAEIRYLDANMPFLNGFPLIPHLSHSDGRKLDIAFFYLDKTTQQPTNEKPSWSGYGIFEGPKAGEQNRIEECKEAGFWQYDKAKYMAFFNNQENFDFDALRTKEMVQLFGKEPTIERMFIEPHLKTRLHLDAISTIGLHGCKAVRHDDHLHIQIKKNIE